MQKPIIFAQVALDNEAFKATPVPTNAEFEIFAVPDVPNASVEVLACSVTWATVPIDGSDAITADLNFRDKSATSNTVLVDDYDFKSTNASLVARQATTFYFGKQVMDAGDSLSLIFATTSPDTAGKGCLITIAYRPIEWNGL